MIPDLESIKKFKIDNNKILAFKYLEEYNGKRLIINDYFHIGFSHIINDFYIKIIDSCDNKIITDRSIESNIHLRYILEKAKDENIKITTKNIKELITRSFIFLYEGYKNNIINNTTKTIFNNNFHIFWTRKMSCFHSHFYSNKKICDFNPFINK